MHTPQLALGFVAIARSTFDIPLATSVTEQVRAQLVAQGFTLLGPDALVGTLDEADAAATQLATEPLDALLVFQSTFADSTMILRLAERVDAPLILWSIPEDRTGDRLRLNSFCGINLAGHALTRAGYVFDYAYAAPTDPAALDKVRAIAQAGHARRRLRTARIGRVGEHPDGFPTCQFDGDALKSRLGVDVVQFALETVFERVREARQPAQVAPLKARVGAQVAGLDDVDQAGLDGTLGTYLTLRDMAQDQRLDGFAVRCWPQFFTELGCAACGALSLMNDDLTPCACETDVNGTITQLILQWISGEPVFGSDMVKFDMDDDVVIFWHCGKAPLSMADPESQPRATIHTNRRMPLLMEFPLKPGRVTVARLSEASGEYRLVVGGGQMVRAPMSFTGTSGALRFDRPAQDVLDTIMSNGLEHHLALTYGDYVPALLALAKYLKLPVLRL